MIHEWNQRIPSNSKSGKTWNSTSSSWKLPHAEKQLKQIRTCVYIVVLMTRFPHLTTSLTVDTRNCTMSPKTKWKKIVPNLFLLSIGFMIHMHPGKWMLEKLKASKSFPCPSLPIPQSAKSFSKGTPLLRLAASCSCSVSVDG